jgi:DNA-binding Lrp family transcriptional regulator
MLSRDQTAYVWSEIRKLKGKDRPIQVRDAFITLMLNIRQDTGECVLTREEIAERIGCAPSSVSRIMSTLERMGVLRRDLTRVEGMRGRGVVTYVVDANVGWNGSLDIRKVEAAKSVKPSLKLVKDDVPSDDL